MKFQMGQAVWFAHTDSVERLRVCPDCLGAKQLRAILGDGSEVAIDCACCERGGFEGSRGTIAHHEYVERATKSQITGIALESGNFVYSGNGFWNLCENDLFDNEHDALERAQVLSASRTTAEIERSLSKEKNVKSWAWHITYHRRCAERAKKELEYHTAKLTLSKTKTATAEGAA